MSITPEEYKMMRYMFNLGKISSNISECMRLILKAQDDGDEEWIIIDKVHDILTECSVHIEINNLK